VSNHDEREVNQQIDQIRQEIRQKMANVSLWCDAGHAFSAKDKGRRTITVTSSDPETGDETSDTRQFCGGCTPTTELLDEPRTRPPGYETAPRTEIAPANADRPF
jgi:hypothetical protein